MKVILSGGGSGKETTEQDRLFVSMLDKTKPLLYLPLAIDSVKHPYPSCIEWLRSTYDPLGITNYIMIDSWNKAKDYANKDPKSFSGVYIGGGNTSYLLKKLRETKFYDFIKKALTSNVPIMGGSAGAIIFAKSIIPSLYHDMNWSEITDFNGLNVLDNGEITCHYTPDQENNVAIMMKNEGLEKLVALTNRNGLFVHDKKIVLIGQEHATIFGRKGEKKELMVGEVLQWPKT